MSTILELLNAQLDQINQSISADWAVILHKYEGKWEIFEKSKIPEAKSLALEKYISDDQVWINSVINSNRVRYKTLKNPPGGFNGSKVFGFGATGGAKLVLFGANELSKSGRSQIKLFAESLAFYNFESLELGISDLSRGIQKILSDIKKSSGLNQALERIIEFIQKSLDIEGIAIIQLGENRKSLSILTSNFPWPNNDEKTSDLLFQLTRDLVKGSENLILPTSFEKNSSSINISPYSTVAGVPINLFGEIVGAVLILDRRSERKIGEKEIKLLENLLPLIALIVKNNMLEKEVQEKNMAQQIVEDRLVQTAKLAAVGEMAAGVAHELNNPLTTVSGFSELLLESMDQDSPDYEDMTLIHKEAHRARAVVRRLLDFTRQDKILHLDADINEILSEVLTLVHHLAKLNDVSISIALWNDLPSLRLEKNQIQQVLLNLIHNAIQAMPSGGELILETQLNEKDNENWVTILIRDNGVGIDEKDLDKIFEPFFTTKVTGEGTGLGLSISYKIISDHDGYIDVDSKPDVGTTFSVWLPVNKSVKLETE
ncbi:MAG: hypothetical protein HON98_07790 [Chloroflexi bacterium]|nr:hypothetical protein [Chloroflexota bacterium]MBT3669846.1 hypothetical protein [Chloroflexota bacterium]MBT4002858.1 hypothetical protein [Chloroflexota bacterium]MBT4304747.1 hypothetical protein [Chloroflexota bacterium]MBT4534751.1 hypothetical protein [Chloroflexota bacterium]